MKDTFRCLITCPWVTIAMGSFSKRPDSKIPTKRNSLTTMSNHSVNLTNLAPSKIQSRICKGPPSGDPLHVQRVELQATNNTYTLKTTSPCLYLTKPPGLTPEQAGPLRERPRTSLASSGLLNSEEPWSCRHVFRHLRRNSGPGSLQIFSKPHYLINEILYYSVH